MSHGNTCKCMECVICVMKPQSGLVIITLFLTPQVPLFAAADESFLRHLAQKVNQMLCMPGDYIVRKGDVGQEVFFIQHGEVEVLSGNDNSKVNLGFLFVIWLGWQSEYPSRFRSRSLKPIWVNFFHIAHTHLSGVYMCLFGVYELWLT